MRDIKIFMNLLGRPVLITKQPHNFMLRGIITEVFDDMIRFETLSRESLIDISLINEISEVARDVSMESCNGCQKGVLYKKTSFDAYCAKCKQDGCEGCGDK